LHKACYFTSQHIGMMLSATSSIHSRTTYVLVIISTHRKDVEISFYI